jgi:hypothetical protein
MPTSVLMGWSLGRMGHPIIALVACAAFGWTTACLFNRAWPKE